MKKKTRIREALENNEKYVYSLEFSPKKPIEKFVLEKLYDMVQNGYTIKDALLTLAFSSLISNDSAFKPNFVGVDNSVVKSKKTKKDVNKYTDDSKMDIYNGSVNSSDESTKELIKPELVSTVNEDKNIGSLEPASEEVASSISDKEEAIKKKFDILKANYSG